MTKPGTAADQTGKDVGYARAADPNNLTREVQALADAGVPVDRVHTDLGHTGDTARPGLEAALDSLTSGDRLVVIRPDRVARRTEQWVAVQERLDAAGATLTVVGGGKVDTAMLMTLRTGAGITDIAPRPVEDLQSLYDTGHDPQPEQSEHTRPLHE